MPEDYLYIFLDEAGDFNFSPTGSKYYVITGLTVKRPFAWYSEFTKLKYELIENGFKIEYFHASENLQKIRDKVFTAIQRDLARFQLDSVIVEKSKTYPALYQVVKFYPKILGYLIRYVIQGYQGRFDKIIIITDRIPPKKKREAVEKAIKITLAAMLPEKVRYIIIHHESRSHFNLQIADYCNWAIYRKWKDSDCRSYDIIKEAIHSEFDIFAVSSEHFY